MEQICKKLRKEKSAETIAEELDEAYDTVKRIVDAARACAPEYDCDAVYQELKGKGKIC